MDERDHEAGNRTDGADGSGGRGTVDSHRTADPQTTRRVVTRAALATAVGLPTVRAVGRAGADGTPASSDEAVLFHRGFEGMPTGDYAIDESKWGGLNPWSGGTEYLSVVEDRGGKVLDARFPAGEAGNGNGGGDFMVPLGERYDELHLGYRVKFGEGFAFDNAGGKLPGLIGSTDGVYAVTGGDDPNGENGWSARMMWRDPVDVEPAEGGLVMFYVYHPDQPGEYGDNMHWDDGPDGQVYFERGTWHEVEHRIVMNTPGENDGVLEGWFDGVKAFERRDLRFRDVPDLGINRFYFSTFFGGGNTPKWAHEREEHVFFDDLVAARESIWNGTDEGPGTPEPGTPDPGEIPPEWPDGTQPGDPNDDGVFEDLNGNDRIDSDDVVVYFENYDEPHMADDAGFYDLNDNGRTDSDDVVTLFESL